MVVPGITVVFAGIVLAGVATVFCIAACAFAESDAVGIIDLSTTSLSLSPPHDARPAITINPAAVYNFNFIRFVLVAQFTGI